MAKLPPPNTITRPERMLAYMMSSILGLSIIVMFVVLVGALLKVDSSQGVWPVLVFLPFIGLPIGFVLLVALLILTAVRRSRAAKGASK